MLGLNAKSPQLVLAVLLLAWLAIAAPSLSEQYSKLTRAQRLLADRSAESRAALLDNPAFPVATEIGGAVPPEECVAIMAYAGPAAIDYYRARFPYLLYPRRVTVSADSSDPIEDCSFLAVFRDTPQNLATEPFAGSWDADELKRRLDSMQRLAASQTVEVYRVP